MPKAARVGDLHTCPLCTGVVPHVGGPILPPGDPTVFIEGLPAARTGDLCACIAPAPDVLVMGSPNVNIGKKMAVRMNDSTAHGGKVAVGAGSVNIGIPGDGKISAVAMAKAAALGSPAKTKGGKGDGKGGKGDQKSNGKGDKKSDEGKKAEKGDPNSCAGCGIEVSCSHERRSANGVLQVVGKGTPLSTKQQKESDGKKLGWVDFGFELSVSSGGHEKIVVKTTPDLPCSSGHAVALSKSSEPAGDLWETGAEAEFDVSWDGAEPIWPSSEPRVWHAFACGCDQMQVNSCRVEVFQPTQVKISLGAKAYRRETGAEPPRKSDQELRQELLGRGFKFFRIEGPNVEEPRGSVALSVGYKEVPHESRVMFECIVGGRIDFGVKVRAYANLARLATALAAAPLVWASRFLEYGIEVELFVGAALSLSCGGDLHISHYAGEGVGGGVSLNADAKFSVETGLKLKAGFEWIQSVSIEAGAVIDFPGAFAVEVNDRGIFSSLNVKRGAVNLFVTINYKGWIWNETDSFTVEVLEESSSSIGYDNECHCVF